MTSLESRRAETTQHLIQRMSDKSEPLADGRMPHQVRQLRSKDTLFISGTRTELTPQNIRIQSALIFSSLERKIFLQNPDFLRNIFSGCYPQSKIVQEGMVIISSGSVVRTLKVNLDGQNLTLAVKYHDEGDNCYPHIRSEPTVVKPDRVSGIDNFLALRAIGLFATNLAVPEPILATRRLFVATLVEGNHVPKGKLPNWVKSGVNGAINQAYNLGWLKKPGKLLGVSPKGFDIDLNTLGNVLEKEGKYYIIDPIL